MSISKLAAQHGEKLISSLIPESQQNGELAKTKTFPTNHRVSISSRTTVDTYRVTTHHGSIVPAYDRPNFRFNVFDMDTH